jgi:hypothetical protein
VPFARNRSHDENIKKMGNILFLKVRLLGCDRIVRWIFTDLAVPATLTFRVTFTETTHCDNQFK